MDVQVCCKGWLGEKCDLGADLDLKKKTFLNEQTKPYATCAMWGKHHFSTFKNNVFMFSGRSHMKTLNFRINNFFYTFNLKLVVNINWRLFQECGKLIWTCQIVLTILIAKRSFKTENILFCD